MSDIGGIQLLPETRKKIEYHAPGQNKLLVFSLIFVALIFAVYGGLLYYRGIKQAALDDVNDQLKKNEEARSKTDENKLLQLKNSLSVVGPLVEKHIYLSNALTHIQGLVHPQVRFDSLSLYVEKKEYVFKAFAASYAVVAKQIAAFYADDTVTDVQVGKISSLPDGKVEFSIILALDLNKIFNLKK